MIETEVRNLVIPTSSYIPAIGSRLYIGTLPDTVTYPAVAMFSISRSEMHESELATERIQFSCYADYLSSATDIADAIKNRVKRFYGTLSTSSTTTFLQCSFESINYQYEAEIQKHVKIMDMFITYR